MRRTVITAIAALFFCAGPAQSYDWFETARVTSVEVSYLPTAVIFKLDKQVGTCAAGALLAWNIRGTDATQRNENAQAVVATLLTAVASGKSITIAGRNDNCIVDNLYLNNI